MDIQYYGAHCVRIVTKEATIVIDDTLTLLGKKPVVKKGDIALFSQDAPAAISEAQKQAQITINTPGEYEIAHVAIHGIAARAHVDEPNTTNSIIFRLISSDIRLAMLGHIHPEVSEDTLEEIGTIDVLIVPVGGNGYTLDPIGASKLIKKIAPKIIIPTHYGIKGFNYEVPQQELEEVCKVLAMEPTETTPKLKLKSSAALPEATQLIVLEPTTS